ncbi:vitamin K epoxide reductase family protein [Neolewinella sp.]|uniref:vitamin K epoxide reductase family protein n=1 Tax=Neolewinella sp. TaxID=2993543 RepID=UPI003B51F3F0
MEANSFQKKFELIEKLLSDPSFPSLSAVTKTLRQFQIETSVGQCDHVESLPSTSNLFVQLIGSGLVYIESISKTQVIYTNGNGNKVSTSIDDFDFEWTGVFILPKINATNNLKIGRNFRYLREVILIMTYLFFSIYFYNLLAFPLLVFAGLVGIYYAFTALYATVDSAYLSLKCGSDIISSCQDVLQSKYAIISEKHNLTMVDLGIIYFASILCLCFVSPTLNGAWKPLALCSCAIIPYSLYIQKFIIKQWCTLCLKIIFAQILVVILAFGGSGFNLTIHENSLGFFIPLVVLPLWLRHKSVVINYLKAKSEMPRFKRIALKRTTFVGLLQDCRKVTNLPLDKIKSDHVIFVFSLSCPHCKKVAMDLLAFWKNNKVLEDIQMYFIVENSRGSVSVSDFNRKQLKLESNSAKLPALELVFSQEYAEEYNPAVFQSDLDKKYSTWIGNNKISKYPQIIYNNLVVSVEYTTTEILSFIFKPHPHV